MNDVFVVDLFPAHLLVGVLDIEKDGRIRRADRPAGLLLGHPCDTLATINLLSLMTSPPAPNKLSSALGLRLGKQVGDRATLDLTFADATPHVLSSVFCVRNSEGTRLQGMLYAPSSGVS